MGKPVHREGQVSKEQAVKVGISAKLRFARLSGCWGSSISGRGTMPMQTLSGGGKDNIFQEEQGVGEAEVGSKVGDNGRESNGADNGRPSSFSSRELTC